MFTNSDSFFEIGTSHRVCEDFSLHGVFDTKMGYFYYSIVSDGCSTALCENGIRNPVNVDIGSRLLALIARNSIEEILINYSVFDYNFKVILEENILKKMINAIDDLCIPPESFRCTLGINLHHYDMSLFLLWGDGGFVFERENEIYIYNFEYKSGAPYYLSYKLDNYINKKYFDEFGKDVIYTIIAIDKETNTIKEENKKIIGCDKSPFYSSFCYPYDSYFTSSIFSDGAMSFVNQDDDSSVPLCEVIDQILNIKIPQGNFMGRVMNLMHRWQKKNKIVHYDDFSVGTILKRPEVNEQ
jgi:hypothetical protein